MTVNGSQRVFMKPAQAKALAKHLREVVTNLHHADVVSVTQRDLLSLEPLAGWVFITIVDYAEQTQTVMRRIDSDGKERTQEEIDALLAEGLYPDRGELKAHANGTQA